MRELAESSYSVDKMGLTHRGDGCFCHARDALMTKRRSDVLSGFILRGCLMAGLAAMAGCMDSPPPAGVVTTGSETSNNRPATPQLPGPEDKILAPADSPLEQPPVPAIPPPDSELPDSDSAGPVLIPAQGSRAGEVLTELPVEAPAAEKVADLLDDEAAESDPFAASDEIKPIEAPPEAKGLRRLAPQYDVWLDRKGKRVVMAGRIAVGRGPLEMFACLVQTKEHESIVAVNTKAMNVHASLVALGIDPGHPVQFFPEERSAAGPEIEVMMHWTDAGGRRRSARAQEWVRNTRTGKELQHEWVFGGSGFDEFNGVEFYLAEQGDLICVSNFPTAMMDLPIKSSEANEALLFEAWEQRIPPRGTAVAIVLRAKKKPDDSPVEAPAPAQDQGAQ